MPTTPEKKPRSSRRAGVPAVDAATSATSAIDALAGAGRAQLAYVPTDLIDPDPRNPEHRVTEIDEDLAASIARDGILTPLLLRPNASVAGRYLVIAGHRRTVHARHVGLPEVPAMVLPERSDLEALRALLIDNVHREDLKPSEEAALVQGLLDLGVDEKALAGEVHRSASWVKARRAVGRLPQSVKARVDERQVTLAQVLEVEEFADDPDIYAGLAQALDEGGYGLTWKLEQAHQARKTKAVMDKVREGIDRLGIPVVPKTSRKVSLQGYGSGTATHGRVGQIGPAARTYFGQATSARDMKALAEQYPNLVAIDRAVGDCYVLAVPLADMPARDEPPVDPEEQARQAVLAEALAACTQDALTAFRLRCAFVVEFATGARKLKPEQVAELASYAVLEALNNDTWSSGVNELRFWLEAAKRCDPGAELVDVERAYASLPAGTPLLLYLAYQAEGPRPDSDRPSWTFGGQAWLDGLRARTEGPYWRTPVAWYALLRRLGYEPSGPELAALAAPPDDGGEPS